MKKQKLLILGANATETEIVKRAKSLGLYVIVTDYYKDWLYAPAKYSADEAWDFNWNDTDLLAKVCSDNNVDGIIAGFSEFKVQALINLTQRLNKPCYITQNQLDLTSDKKRFKNLCRECNIPVVESYEKISDVTNFPVIVKPVDRGGSIGITVCYNLNELKKAYKIAKSLSPTSNVVIEKYLGDQTKIDLYYVIQNYEPFLFTTNDTIMAQESKGREILQSIWLFPSIHEQMIRHKLDPNICNLINKLGIKNGYITISGFIDASDNITIFETGCRLSGELSYKMSELTSGNNYMDILIDIALGNDVKKKDYRTFEESYLSIYNIYANNGTIGSKIVRQSHKSDIEVIDFLPEGILEINHTGPLPQKVAMVFASAKSRDILIQKSEEASSMYELMDSSGVSLIVRPSRLECSDVYETKGPK